MNTITQWKNTSLFDVDESTHPAGRVDLTELSDFELDGINGAAGTALGGTWGCCWCVPWYSSWTQCGVICSHPGCSY
ncbi:mersacidin/lichenicidin family type 2 lantibiotic [Cryobacterium sp. Y57]|uniref:mersacidin/lichenicidin family type 2 lantibiotic n=1 Tax=Cryobacterium sp. Y57 TaxID=2048287 RepID=UPI0011B00F6E